MLAQFSALQCLMFRCLAPRMDSTALNEVPMLLSHPSWESGVGFTKVRALPKGLPKLSNGKCKRGGCGLNS